MFLIFLEFLLFCDSSSGILEAPYYKIPTINIGKRQDGRIRHPSVIDTDYSSNSIADGIKKGLSSAIKKNIQNMKYEFGDGSASQIIHDVLVKELKKEGINIKSGFLVDELNRPGDGGLLFLEMNNYRNALKIIKQKYV